ncbi:MAG: hypothetical protein WA667_30450 [Candidatus Nitrosopolaris sp.]
MFIDVYRLFHKSTSGGSNLVPQRGFVNTASKEEKEEFKKKTREIISRISKDFTVAVEDESVLPFFRQ